jgi:hypothetical protein
MVYGQQQYLALEKQPFNNGNEAICGNCGDGFRSDRWSITTELVVDGESVIVETYALTSAHGPDRNEFYETMVHGLSGDVEDRYETEDEAIDGHERIVEKLRAGEFHKEVVAERLVIEDDNE